MNVAVIVNVNCSVKLKLQAPNLTLAVPVEELNQSSHAPFNSIHVALRPHFNASINFTLEPYGVFLQNFELCFIQFFKVADFNSERDKTLT